IRTGSIPTIRTLFFCFISLNSTKLMEDFRQPVMEAACGGLRRSVRPPPRSTPLKTIHGSDVSEKPGVGTALLSSRGRPRCSFASARKRHRFRFRQITAILIQSPRQHDLEGGDVDEA